MSRALKRKVNRIWTKFMGFILVLIGIVLLIAFVYAQNNVAIPTSYIFESDKLPKTFTGYKIVQMSDICNDTNFSEHIVDRQNPNLVIVTGNLCDTNGNYNKSVKLIKDLASKYTVVYVLGEMDQEKATDIKAELDSAGAVCLENKSFNIDAPSITYEEYVDRFIEDNYIKDAENPESESAKYLEYTKQALADDADKQIAISGLPVLPSDTDFIDTTYGVINLDRELFQILVMNQGQYFDKVSQVDVDVITSGNTFGKDRFTVGYSRGIYNNNGTTMFLSGGVGKIPNGVRILNFPDVVCITLSDGTINNDNPLEKFLGRFITDVGTRFDGDGGFTVSRTYY